MSAERAPESAAQRFRPRPLLFVKLALSVVMAGVVAVFTRFMALTFPAWAIGVGVGLFCLGQLVKAALDDYEEAVRRG